MCYKMRLLSSHYWLPLLTLILILFTHCTFISEKPKSALPTGSAPPEGNKQNWSGTFQGVGNYSVSGMVKFGVNAEGNNTLTLQSDFQSSSGPGLYVYLSAESGRPTSSSIDLGSLQSTSGSQTYAVSNSVNIADFPYVLIHCRPFNVPFGHAQLMLTPTPPNNNGQDNNGQDNNGQDNNGQDNNGQDNNGQDNNGQDNNGQDNNGQDNNGQDNNGQDNNGQDNNGGNMNNLQQVWSGTFQGAGGYSVSGSVEFNTSNNTLTLQSDFRSSSGPGLYVYLSAASGRPTSSSTSLGELKSISGSQTYTVPNAVNIVDSPYVLIHCRPFNVPFGHAQLMRP